MDRVDPSRGLTASRRARARGWGLLVLGLALAGAVLSGAALPRPADARPTPIRAVPDHAVTFELRDGLSGRPTAARLRVIGSDGRDYYPLPREAGFYHESYFGQHYFYAEGDLTLRVPPGRTILWACRGFEYVTHADTFDVAVDQRRRVDFIRFDDLPALGWRSGDTHIHINHGGVDVYNVDADAVAMMQRAEDLGVASVLEDATTFTGQVDPRSTEDHLLVFGGEYRSAFWGHLDVLGVNLLPYLFCCSTGQPAFPMNVDLVREARAAGGMVFFAHPITVPRNQLGITTGGWPFTGHGRELPIDVALGSIDAFDVMSYSNRNRIELSAWYDMLNHGFHLPAAAGTDAAVNRTTDPPAGGYRVYARVGPGPFTYAAWLEAIRGGASFVTNGPLVHDFTVDGFTIGQTAVVDSAHSFALPVKIDVTSQWPIERVSLIVNGLEQAYFFPTGEGRYHFTANSYAGVYGTSGWVALKVYAPWANPGPFFTIGTQLYAHTSPIYFQVPGRPQAFWSPDPYYYRNWIDQVWSLADARGWASPADHDTALARVNLARQIILSRTGGYPFAPSGPDRADREVTLPSAAAPGVNPLPDDPQWRDLPAAPCADAEAPFNAPVPREFLYFAPGVVPDVTRNEAREMGRGAVRVTLESAPGGALRFRLAGAPAPPELIEIFDISGRHVATRRLAQTEAGRDGFTWHPAALGRPVAAGLYLVRVVGNGWSAETKISLR